jgi:hypothetical protein
MPKASDVNRDTAFIFFCDSCGSEENLASSRTIDVVPLRGKTMTDDE